MTDAAEATESADGAAAASKVGVPETFSRGQRVLHPSRDNYLETAQGLHEEGFFVCVDVTGVDYLTYQGRRDLPKGIEAERFEVVANLLSHQACSRVRLRVQVSEDDPTVPSLYGVYPSVEAFEREVFDLFGVVFEGHPDLTRIVLPEDWEGHPLRKDAPAGRIPVQFKSVPGT